MINVPGMERSVTLDIGFGGRKNMEKITKTYRGVDEDLVKEVQHLAIDEGRNEGELINEALMLLIKAYQDKKSHKKMNEDFKKLLKGVKKHE